MRSGSQLFPLGKKGRGLFQREREREREREERPAN
jgi:hypothetical protein